MIWDHFILLPFLAGLLVGFVSITFRKPDDSMRVPKWPHPSTVGKFTYRDRNGLCYTFDSEEVDCTKVKESLKDYPFEN
jgi:hypothetical protein